MFKVGDRVRHSGQALQSSRDWWQQQGEYGRKQKAKEAYEKLVAERGTVVAILTGDQSRGVSPGVEVKWDSGSVCRCLPYRISIA